MAVDVARRSGRRLLLAGKVDIGDRPWFQARVEPLVDGDRIRIVGEVDEPAKAKLLADASALLFPIAWDELFGLVVVEALAAGTPVIRMRRASVPELVEHGETGFVVDDVDGMVWAVDQLDVIDHGRGADATRNGDSASSGCSASSRTGCARPSIAARAPGSGRRPSRSADAAAEAARGGDQATEPSSRRGPRTGVAASATTSSGVFPPRQRWYTATFQLARGRWSAAPSSSPGLPKRMRRPSPPRSATTSRSSGRRGSSKPLAERAVAPAPGRVLRERRVAQVRDVVAAVVMQDQQAAAGPEHAIRLGKLRRLDTPEGSPGGSHDIGRAVLERQLPILERDRHDARISRHRRARPAHHPPDRRAPHRDARPGRAPAAPA